MTSSFGPRLRGVAAAVLVAGLTVVGSPPSHASTHYIDMIDAPPYYDPVVQEVKVGDTVVWRNAGPDMPHFIVSEDMTLVSHDIVVGKEWRATFNKAGVYPYICFRHFFMRGTVVVRNPDGTTDTAPEHAYQAAMKEFVIPTADAGPRMIIASRVDDTMWFTEGGGGFYGFEDVPAQNKLAQVDHTGRIIEYATPTPGTDGTAVGVDSLVMDATGAIWFTERVANRIGRLDPSGVIREFPLPTKDGYVLGIDLDHQGNLWFAERHGNRLGRMTPDGLLSFVTLLQKDSEPRTVFVDSRQRVWYTARVANEIGYYDPAAARLVHLQIPTKLARPAGICETSDGTIYFVEMVGNKLARVIGDQITEFALPTRFSAPFKCAVDARDNVWFTQVFGNSVGKFDPRTGRIVEFKIPTADSRPGGIAIDSKGRIWFTEQKGNKIGMFDPAAADVAGSVDGGDRVRVSAAPPPRELTAPRPAAHAPIHDFTIPTRGGGPGNDLVEDNAGWLWFTEIFANKIGAVHIATQRFKEFELPSSVSMPVGIARGDDGALWITEFRGNRLARLLPATGTITEYALPQDGALPAGVTVDEHGDVWLTQLAGNRIARFDRATERFEEFELPRPSSSPLQIVSDRRGGLFITASEEHGNYLARFTIATQRFDIFDLPTPNASPVGMLVDGDVVWVAEGGGAKLARFDIARQTWDEFPIPAERSEPVKLAKDRYGRIWLTDGGGLGSSGGNRLAVFDPRAKTFVLIPMKRPDAKPMGIVAASDGNVWFTQQGANRVSRIALEETTDDGHRH
jgi:streptogramin lyase/plastocyanin